MISTIYFKIGKAVCKRNTKSMIYDIRCEINKEFWCVWPEESQYLFFFYNSGYLYDYFDIQFFDFTPIDLVKREELTNEKNKLADISIKLEAANILVADLQKKISSADVTSEPSAEHKFEYLRLQDRFNFLDKEHEILQKTNGRLEAENKFLKMQPRESFESLCGDVKNISQIHVNIHFKN